MNLIPSEWPRWPLTLLTAAFPVLAKALIFPVWYGLQISTPPQWQPFIFLVWSLLAFDSLMARSATVKGHDLHTKDIEANL